MQQATNALAHPPDSSATMRWRNEQSLLATSVQNRHPARVAVLHCHFWPLFVCMQPARVRPVPLLVAATEREICVRCCTVA